MANHFPSSFEAHPQRTNIFAFLKAIPYLNALSNQTILQLSERFGITPETLSLLIHIAIKGLHFHNN